MQHRGGLSTEERHLRSRLFKLLDGHSFVRGSLVSMPRTCGKSSCKCLSGEKHVSLYLSVRVVEKSGKTKRKMIYVPPKWEDRVRAWVEIYQQSDELLDGISRQCLLRLLAGKKEE